VFLRLAAQWLADDPYAPFLSQIGPLTKHLGFKVFGEAKLHAPSLWAVIREASLLNGPR
jgi:hypothetical protein